MPAENPSEFIAMCGQPGCGKIFTINVVTGESKQESIVDANEKVGEAASVLYNTDFSS